jgi:tRNA A37 threonylcarbamoyltransferase TsaD
MSAPKQIKVIKKEQRNRKETKVQKGARPREAARDMVQTVTNWVNELQQKRRAETSEALKMLLRESNTRPSEA